MKDLATLKQTDTDTNTVQADSITAEVREKAEKAEKAKESVDDDSEEAKDFEESEESVNDKDPKQDANDKIHPEVEDISIELDDL